MSGIKKITILLFFITFLNSTDLFSAEKMRIAVLDLKANNISKSIARAAADLIRANLITTGHFTVIERVQMDTILKEQEIQQAGCTDNTCAVEMGKLLSANKTLVGEISSVGKTVVITIRIVDVEKGTADFSSMVKAVSLDVFDTVINKLTGQLIDSIGGKSVSKIGGLLDKPGNLTATKGAFRNRIFIKWSRVEKADSYYLFRSREFTGSYQLIKTTKNTFFKDTDVLEGVTYFYKVRTGLFSRFSDFQGPVEGRSGYSKQIYYTFGIIPGAGQLYTNNNLKGSLFLGGFLLSSGWGIYSYKKYIKKRDEYHSLAYPASRSDFDSKYDSYKRWANIAFYSLAAWGVVYIANWLDIIFFNEVFYPGESSKNNTGVSFNLNMRSETVFNNSEEMRMLVSAVLRF